jgi:hypothetical protein
VALESLALALILLVIAALARSCLGLRAAVRRFGDAPWLPAEALRGMSARQIVAVFDPDRVPWSTGKPPARASIDRNAPPSRPRHHNPGRIAGFLRILAAGSGTDPFAHHRQSRLSLLILPRQDKEQLEDGSRVWVVPTGRTLRHHRRSGPYAVVRARDRKVFWGTGRSLPGRGW